MLESLRREKPDLDLVLTQVDDRFDTGMREAIGADAARVLPMLDTHSFTFLIEDPATVWNLGPQRYQAIAERYHALTNHGDKLAIDLNIVDRYQNVYPTKQQTGTELFELVHNAARNFERVTLYFENSLLAPDLAAALGRGAGQPGGTDGAEDCGGLGPRGGRSVARRGSGGRPALAGAGCGNRVAAGRGACCRIRETGYGATHGEAQCRAEGGARDGFEWAGILVPIIGARHRDIRPAPDSVDGGWWRRGVGICRSEDGSVAARSARRDNHVRVS